MSEARSALSDPSARTASWPRTIAVGAAAGAVSGLFGVGGGILIVPALVIILRTDQRLAHGTSLAATAYLAFAGVASYALEGSVDWLVALLLFAGSAGGAVAGTYALGRIDQRALRVGFATLLVLTAARMFLDAPDPTGAVELTAASALGLAGVGLASGTLAGLMGVGGGIIMVPAQVLLFGVPGALAKGTALAVIVPTAIVGTSRNVKYRNTELDTAWRIGVSGMVTSFVAAKFAIELSEVVAATLFAGLLTVVALRLLARRQPDGDHVGAAVTDAGASEVGRT